jgi:hypothetical protein
MGSKVLLTVLALIAAGLAVQRSCAGSHGSEVGTTQEIVGTWTTTAPSHADRFFEIRAQEVVFGQGEEGSERHRIVGVTRRVDPQGRTRYLVRYQMASPADGEATLELLVEDPYLVIAGQPEIQWLRAR